MERGWLAIPFLVVVFFSLPPLASWATEQTILPPNFILRLGIIRENETHLVMYIKNIFLLFSTLRNKMQNTYANTGRICCFRYELVYLFLTFVSSTRGERHNFYYADHLQWAAHLVMFKICVGKDLQNLTTYLNCIRTNSPPQWLKLNSLPIWSNINSQLTLFQNPQIIRTISSGHDVIHTPIHFLSGVYNDNGDCHILCARA